MAQLITVKKAERFIVLRRPRKVNVHSGAVLRRGSNVLLKSHVQTRIDAQFVAEEQRVNHSM